MFEITQVSGRDTVALRYRGGGDGLVAVARGGKSNRNFRPLFRDAAIDRLDAVAEPVQNRVIPRAFGAYRGGQPGFRSAIGGYPGLFSNRWLPWLVLQ